jgi:arginyl-tRNA synthetase
MLFAEDIARLLEKEVKLPLPQIIALLETPPDPAMGDVAFPCFILAKERQESPVRIATEIALMIKPQLPVESITSAGPYVNFSCNKALIAEHVLTRKRTPVKRKERVMIEHSNGNTHKEVHIGHLRNLSLGDATVRIARAAGFPVVNAYYINDTGAHVAKCLWSLLYRHEGEEPPKEKRLSWLAGMYREGTKAAEEDPAVKAAIDGVLQKLENGEKDITDIWKRTRQWSIDDWHRIFEQLEMLPFDAKFYDSEVTKDVKPIVDRLLEKGIVREDDGALIADLEEEGLHVVIIRKRDDTTPYIAKDLALADRKFTQYQIDRSVYVVASEQELHFKQLFKILEKDGFPQAKKCHHVSYGLVMLASGKMSSREGTVILFDDLYQDVYDHALDEVKKRHEDWEEKRKAEAAKAITLAALKFPMVAQEPIKRIIFDVRKSLDFEGETGPYLQYAYARLCSVLRKHGKKVTDNVEFSALSSPEEQAILKLLSTEQDSVEDAAEKYRPASVARYALDLAQAINSFYHAQQVLVEDETLRKARLLLVLKAKESLGRMTELLGIPLLEEM